MQIKLNLKGGYKTVQEGQRVLEITSAKVSPSGKPTKLTLLMKDTEDGASLQNSYNINNDANVKKVISRVDDEETTYPNVENATSFTRSDITEDDDLS